MFRFLGGAVRPIAAGVGTLLVVVAALAVGMTLTGAADPVAGVPPGNQEAAAPVLLAQATAAAAPANVIDAFTRAGCINCHTIPGVPGAAGTVGPDLSRIGAEAATRKPGMSATDYIRESILDPNAFIAPTCPSGPCPAGVMLQAFAQTLGPEQLDAIVGYLATLGTAEAGAEAAATLELSVSLPPESVLEPFAALPRPPASEAQIALGKYLFFDSRLSGNNSLSCASCHQPEQAFSDGQAISRGYPSTQYFRNTPTLLNSAFARQFYWDGRLSGSDMPTLVRDHLTEAHFMSIDGRLMVERLKQVPEYVSLFGEAFGGGPSFGRVLNAISAYVQTLNSPPTAYDAFMAGDESALSADAQAGLELFTGKAGCAACHSGPLLSDGGYYDLGVPTDEAFFDDPELHLTFRRFFAVLGTPAYRNLREDVGRYAMTLGDADWGRFRTPSLREVGRTAPYMHNGAFANLREVVAFYNQGGGEGQDAGLEPLGLSDTEIDQLVAFLESLSSEPVAVAVPELPPYGLLELGDPAAMAAILAEASAEASATTVATAVAAAAEFPPLAPLPPVSAPPDNPITEAKVELGRMLFFDPRMSADGSMSCNSCHPAGSGWGVPAAISFGGAGTSHWRNAQTILNVGYYGKLNWDGARGSIEKQNAGAWGGAVAGNLDSMLAEARLAQIPEYVERFSEVFGSIYPTWNDALLAVAAYQRTITSRNVPFDAFLAGDENAISDAAKRGFELFTGQAGCIACHNGPLASDDDYHALGVPQNPEFSSNPLRQITFRYEQWAKGATEDVYLAATEDLGLYYVTKQTEDMGKFRTPSLRDLCYTAPYMHNGVFATLDEVLAFYNAGGGDHPNKDPALQPLGLNADQLADVGAFLESLCGDRVTDEAPVLPPYGTFAPGGE